MTKLSINLNKVALIRNSRGANLPDLLKVALDCEEFGAEGITIHPRPDERHARFDDIGILKNNIKTELNIEGYPSKRFIKAVLLHKPTQVTLVPDPPDALTSSSGWDTIVHKHFLTEIIAELKHEGIRTSIFLNPDERFVEGAAEIGVDRIELYTGNYANNYVHNREEAIRLHIAAANRALDYKLGLNAGHDLNLENLKYYKQAVKNLLEVSIGHALICDSLYYGLKNTIQMYLFRLK